MMVPVHEQLAVVDDEAALHPVDELAAKGFSPATKDLKGFGVREGPYNTMQKNGLPSAPQKKKPQNNTHTEAES